ncbi:hypothetical protein BB561_002983 [Smittium simulii]|uniref:Acyl-protein thioesterase 1 n=1 Tax=Smittium simulii TaxID=133385 RepID=A0A2T9YNE5_9FUNG|nr:hypothetical protein BB561_002983 [Smittium simulii]
MLKFVTKAAPKAHTATVVFLHGLGDSGHGWAPIADSLEKHLPHVKFIFPHAPVQPVTLNYGMEMNSWYDIYSLKDRTKQDEKGVLESVDKIKKLLNEEISSGISSDRIVLGGFSQGAAISYTTGLSFESKLAGIVALSGYIPIDKKTMELATEINKSTKIFIGHGTSDTVVDYELGVESAEELKKMSYNVEFNSYEGLDHSSCLQELSDLTRFLTSVIPETK